MSNDLVKQLESTSVLVHLSEHVFGNGVGRHGSPVAVEVSHFTKADVKNWIVIGLTNGIASVVFDTFR
jgi:hypothetical protein